MPNKNITTSPRSRPEIISGRDNDEMTRHCELEGKKFSSKRTGVVSCIRACFSHKGVHFND